MTLTLAAALPAAEPAPVETLPVPRPALPPGPPPPPPVPVEWMLFPRQSHYAVWQYSGVDLTGHWRPRVISTPSGEYYYYNGAPYPWLATHPLEYRPYVSNPATFYNP